MSKLLNILIVVVILAFLLFKFVLFNSIEVGNEAAEIEETLLDGTPFTLSSLRGNYVLIDFWGSWCPPCRKQNKDLVKLYGKFENKSFEDGDGFKIVSIAIEKKAENAKKAIAKDNLYWPHHIVQQNKFVLQNSLALKYGVKDLPSTFLLNPEGKIMATNKHPQELDQLLSARLK